MAQNGRSGSFARVSPLKPGLRGASRLVQSRLHAGIRAATYNRKSLIRSTFGLLTVLFFLAFCALWLGGYLPTVRQNLVDYKQERLMAMGFVVEQIDVMGEGRLNEADVRAAIGIYHSDYFFKTDLVRAQERTESLPWVDRAVVRRLWPNRIVVQLVETTPVALYQEGGEIFLADSKGAIVAPLTAETAALPANLRLFTGPDATLHAGDIKSSLEVFPSIWAETEALTRQVSGRWDLTLKDGLVLRLPENNLDAALSRFDRIPDDQRSRFAIIDMRLPDRVTLTPKDVSQT